MREAEHLASLPVVLTQWSSLTPLIPSKLGHGWGWGCVCMCGDDEEEVVVVVGGLIPLGGVKEGGRSRTDRQSKHRRAFGGK